jgi:hypothetical protein
MAGIYVAVMFSIATVYLGLQTIPLLFLVTGWAVAYLDSGVEGIGAETSAPVQPAPTYRFRRIMGAPTPLPAPAFRAGAPGRAAGPEPVRLAAEAPPKPRRLVGAIAARAQPDGPRVMLS